MNELYILYGCDEWQSHASSKVLALFQSVEDVQRYLSETYEIGDLNFHYHADDGYGTYVEKINTAYPKSFFSSNAKGWENIEEY